MKAKQIAKSMKAPASDSTLATLDSHTTTKTIRAARPAGLHTGATVNFSGQYLFDRLIGDNAEEVTKMDLVRQMVGALDMTSFKKSIGDMVGVAKGFLDNATEEAKRAGGFDPENPPAAVAIAQATYKTAQNHQTVLRVAFGAIKFAPEELAACGYTEKTGYQVMRVIARKALDAKGLKWDGTKAEGEEVKAERLRIKAEGLAMAQAMEENPKKEGEARDAYFARIDKIVTRKLKEKQEEEHIEQVNKLVAKMKELAGPLLGDVLDALMTPHEEEEEVAA